LLVIIIYIVLKEVNFKLEAYRLKKKVLITCASWFSREDGLVQIRNKKGKLVILNNTYSAIWTTINYEAEMGILVQKLKDAYPEETVLKCISDLEESDLVSVFDDSDNFDLMFS
jgi:hypothetical protein